MLVIPMVTKITMLMMAMTMSMEINNSTVRFVEMFYKSLKLRTQGLIFERIKIRFYCRTQWKVARPKLRSQQKETHHLVWFSFAPMEMESASMQRISKIRNQMGSCYKLILKGSEHPFNIRCWSCLDIKETCSSNPETTHLAASNLADNAITV